MFPDAMPPEYDEIDDALHTLDDPPTAAEIHGHLLGCAAAGALGADAWLERLVDEAPTGPLPAPLRPVLTALYQHTAKQLQQGQLELALLLPDDQAPLAERVEALALWCQGFLSGYGLSPASAGNRKSPEAAAEIDTLLRDIAAISQAVPGDDSEAEAERDLFELTEYVRLAAAQLCWDHWGGGAAGLRLPQGDPSAGVFGAGEADGEAGPGDPASLFRRGPLH